jgi:hypothetical protein
MVDNNPKVFGEFLLTLQEAVGENRFQRIMADVPDDERQRALQQMRQADPLAQYGLDVR